MGEVRGAVETSGSLHSCLVKPPKFESDLNPQAHLYRSRASEIRALNCPAYK